MFTVCLTDLNFYCVYMQAEMEAFFNEDLCFE